MKFIHLISIGVTVICTGTLSLFSTPATATNLVRKNILDLTAEEKTEFVNALYSLKNTIPEGSTLSIYDQFAASHLALMTFEPMQMFDDMGNPMFLPPTATGPAAGTSPAHGNDAFLPWHREFLARFEDALQTVDPNVTIPYWDFTDPRSLDVIFQPDFMGSRGEGTIEIPGAGVFQGGPVESNFSEDSGWVLNPDINLDFGGQSRGSALARFMFTPPTTEYPIPKEDVDKILSYDSYDAYESRDPQFKDNPFLRNTYSEPSFRPALEGWFREDDRGNLQPGFYMHNYLHGLVGGQILAGFDPEGRPIPLTTLGTLNFPSAPYDPVFWLIHSNIDRIWAQWQANGYEGSDYYPAEGQPYGHNLNDRMWPWDGGDSSVGMMGSVDLPSILPTIEPDDLVTPADTLDISDYGYTYDTFATSVPEPTSTFALLGLGILGFSSWLTKKQKQKA